MKESTELVSSMTSRMSEYEKELALNSPLSKECCDEVGCSLRLYGNAATLRTRKHLKHRSRKAAHQHKARRA